MITAIQTQANDSSRRAMAVVDADEGFVAVFAFCAVLLLFLLMYIGWTQATIRAFESPQTRRMANPEDEGGVLWGFGKNSDVNSDDSAASALERFEDRVGRIGRNQHENVFNFMAIGVLWVLVGASPDLGKVLCVLYTFGRYLYTVNYVMGWSFARTMSHFFTMIVFHVMLIAVAIAALSEYADLDDMAKGSVVAVAAGAGCLVLILAGLAFIVKPPEFRKNGGGSASGKINAEPEPEKEEPRAAAAKRTARRKKGQSKRTAAAGKPKKAYSRVDKKGDTNDRKTWSSGNSSSSSSSDSADGDGSSA
jgi:uncharacterized MAPEG superfamily protein